MKSKFLGELGFKSWVYENHIISYSCIFFHIFSSFEERLHQILLIFKNSFFLQFRSIESVFRSIEIAIKNFSESLSISIDRNCFSINRILWIRFFKIQCLIRSKHFFQKFFQLFSLSLWLGKAKSSNFCCFPPNLLQGFPLPKPVSPFYPCFCILFHVCMHKFMHLFEIFGPCTIWDFFFNQALFYEIDQWVLLLYWYIHDLWWLIWSIWGFCEKLKF